MATELTADIADRARFRFALLRLEAYVRAAAPQAERIALAYRAAEAMRTTNAVLAQELHAAALVEAHYYFITWHGAWVALKALKESELGLETPGRVYERYIERFKSYTDARHHLEHYDERLPGGERTDWVQSDTDTISGTVPVLGSESLFCFRGNTWDVGRASAEVLIAIFNELLVGVRDEIKARRADPSGAA